MSVDEPDERTPAERRLDEHLELLREDESEGDDGRSLTRRIVSTARWQRTLRAPVAAVATVVGSVADGLFALLGGRRRRSP
jgi:hypothetical protein